MRSITPVARRGVFALAMLAAAAPHAGAQDFFSGSRVFFDINAGYQTGTARLDDRRAFSLYGEQGRFDGRYAIDRDSGLFDISGGVHVWRRLAVGAGFSRGSSRHRAEIRALVPHPFFYARPRSTVSEVRGLAHTERAVYIQASWTLPVRRRVAIRLVGGPTIFSLRQDLVTAVATREVAAPYDTVQIAAVSTVAHRRSAIGGHVGIDVSLMVTRRIGGGLFVRYATASPELDLDTGRASVKVGGLQTGLGLRLLF